MKIKATRLITQEAELDTPSWWKKGSRYLFVTERAIIDVVDNQVTKWENDVYRSPVFQEKALDASTGEPITQEEFEQKYTEVVGSFDGVVSARAQEPEEKALVVTEVEKWAGIR